MWNKIYPTSNEFFTIRPINYTLMLNTLHFPFTIFYVTTYAGAICGHILSNIFPLNSAELAGTQPFFEKLIPNQSTAFYFRCDCILLPIIGAFLGYCFLDPTTIKASVCAGLCWRTSLTAFTKKR